MKLFKSKKKGAVVAPFCFAFACVSVVTTGLFASDSIAMNKNAMDSESTMVLNYDGFFDRIEKLDDPEFMDVKLAFYLKRLKDGSTCPIKSVNLKTKLKNKSVYFLDNGEVILPYDKQLDLDKAHVVIEKNTFDECGLDMRLESTKLFNKEVSVEDINQLTKSFDGALKELAGMMSFLTPDVVGVTFVSSENSTLSLVNSKLGKCNENRCTITINNLVNTEVILFNQKPDKAIPFIKTK